MEFVKAQANGNDFIIIRRDCFAQTNALMMCDRHYGIGADGILLWEKINGHYFMHIINADGTESEICVNGLRVLGKYLMDLLNMDSLIVETRAGMSYIESAGDKIDAVIGLGDVKEGQRSLEIDGRAFEIYYYFVNNPHGLYFGDWEEDDFFRYAERIQNEMDKANISFVRDMGEKYYAMVWERGVGYTLSCGSAAIAIFYHLCRKHGMDKACIEMAGGEYRLFKEGDSVRIRGGADIVFCGRI